MTPGTTLDGLATCTAWQAVSVAYGRDDIVNLPGLPSQPPSMPRSGPQSFRQGHRSRSVSIKLQAVPLRVQRLFPFAQAGVCHAPLSFSQSPRFQLWTGQPVAIASTRCQPVALSYPHRPIFKLDSLSLKFPAPSDATGLGSAARQVIDLTDDDGLPLPSEIIWRRRGWQYKISHGHLDRYALHSCTGER
jgi:hypothetical protein